MNTSKMMIPETRMTTVRPVVLPRGTAWLSHSDRLASRIPQSPTHELLALAVIPCLLFILAVCPLRKICFSGVCVLGAGGGAKVCFIYYLFIILFIWRNVFMWPSSVFGGMFTPDPLPAGHVPSSQPLVLWTPWESCQRRVPHFQADTDRLRFWS